jgi:hypothetical protein
MHRAYGTWCKWEAIFINGLKSVATTWVKPMALVNTGIGRWVEICYYKMDRPFSSWLLCGNQLQTEIIPSVIPQTAGSPQDSSGC